MRRFERHGRLRLQASLGRVSCAVLEVMMVRLSDIGGMGLLAALVIAPSQAAACLPPAGPPPSPAERAAALEKAQAEVWSVSALVYEAEITESFMVVGPDPKHPGVETGFHVRAVPVSLVKGADAPPSLLFSYGLGPECVFGPSNSPRAGAVGSRFLIYSYSPTLRSTRDVYATFPVGVVTNADTLSALSVATRLTMPGADNTPSNP